MVTQASVGVSAETAVGAGACDTGVGHCVGTTFGEGLDVVKIFAVTFVCDSSSISLTTQYRPFRASFPHFRFGVVLRVLLLVIPFPVRHVGHCLVPLSLRLPRQ